MIKKNGCKETLEKIFIPFYDAWNFKGHIKLRSTFMSKLEKVNVLHFLDMQCILRSLCFTFRETSSSKETLVKWTTCFMLPHQKHLSYFFHRKKKIAARLFLFKLFPLNIFWDCSNGLQQTNLINQML